MEREQRDEVREEDCDLEQCAPDEDFPSRAAKDASRRGHPADPGEPPPCGPAEKRAQRRVEEHVLNRDPGATKWRVVEPVHDRVAPDVADESSADVGKRSASDEHTPATPRDRTGWRIVSRWRLGGRDRRVDAKLQ